MRAAGFIAGRQRSGESAALSAAQRYDRTARAAAATVIDQYSTSFGLACRLLGPSVRADVKNVYALVRVADEVVDGAGCGFGVDPPTARCLVDLTERETLAAIERGFSTDRIIHAFARTARRAGIGAALIRPFFDSMRTDLDRGQHSPGSLDRYVYGSAEVVGLMCLRIFLADQPVDDARRRELEHGARALGAAFQKVNFLRDLGEDYAELGRVYLPGSSPEVLTEAAKIGFLDEIDQDLAVARATIDALPPSARTAVLCTHDLFATLSAQLRRTPAADVARTRIRVPDPLKAVVVLRAVATARNPGVRRGLRSARDRRPRRDPSRQEQI